MDLAVKIITIIYILVVLPWVYVQAETAPPEGPRAYSIEELVERAHSQYPLLASAHLKIEEIISRGRHEGRWQNPSISASGGARLSENDTGYEYGVSLEQGFYFPGKQRLKRDIMRFREQHSRLSARDLRNYIRLEVTRLSCEYAVAMIKMEHVEERLKRFRLIEAYMKGRVAASPQQRVEKNIIESKTLLMSRHINAIRQQAYVLFNRLNLYTCIKSPTLPRVDVSWYTKAPAVDFDGLSAVVNENNIAILKRMASIKESEAELKLAARESAPDLDTSVYFNEESLEGQTERSVGAEVTLPLPILDQNKHARRAAEKKIEAEKLKLEHTRNRVLSELSALTFQYRNASHMIIQFPLSRINTIDKIMSYADREFKKGRIDLGTYLELDSETHEIMQQIYSSQLDLVTLYAKIQYLRGE